MTSNLDGVFETFGCDQSGTGAFAFQQGVGADRRAVQDYQLTLVIDFAESFYDGL